MNLDLNQFVEKYIVLCSQLCQKAEDYTQENVKKHNRAMKKLNALKEEIYTDYRAAEAAYGILLNNKDAYVRQAAATDCLSMKIHIDASISILRDICRHGDKMSAMGAERALLIWKGKIDPNDPY